MAAWEHQQGYEHAAGVKESAAAYEAFVCYLELGRKRTMKKVAKIVGEPEPMISQYGKRYAWTKRAAAWDADQIRQRFDEVRKKREEEHREAILKFRDDQARRARAMGGLAELMLDLTQEKLLAMQAAGELPSEQQLSNLAKTVATLSDTSMNLEATALGVEELLDGALNDG